MSKFLKLLNKKPSSQIEIFCCATRSLLIQKITAIKESVHNVVVDFICLRIGDIDIISDLIIIVVICQVELILRVLMRFFMNHIILLLIVAVLIAINECRPVISIGSRVVEWLRSFFELTLVVCDAITVPTNLIGYKNIVDISIAVYLARIALRN